METKTRIMRETYDERGWKNDIKEQAEKTNEMIGYER